MNKYDFDNLANRRNSNSIKWDVEPDFLPMSIADQDFITFNPIYEAIKKEADIKAYGYIDIKKDYFAAYRNWFLSRYNLDLDINKMIFSEGVVASISAICNYFLHDDNVTIITPVYNIFRNSIINNHGHILECPLIEENQDFRIDYDKLEECLKKSKVLIFCNPQNPTGNVWDLDDLKKVGILARKYNVLVISDEIHCDFTKDKEYKSYLMIEENKENSVILLSPTKTFNIAGLKSSIAYTEDENLFNKVFRAINNVEVGEPNTFAIKPVIEAYNKGSDYVDALNEYIYQNKLLCYDFISNYLPNLKYKIKSGLYLIWIDASYYNNKDLALYLKNEAKIGLIGGAQYGDSGAYYLRMNLATSKENVQLCLNRLKEALDELE